MFIAENQPAINVNHVTDITTVRGSGSHNKACYGFNDVFTGTIIPKINTKGEVVLNVQNEIGSRGDLGYLEHISWATFDKDEKVVAVDPETRIGGYNAGTEVNFIKNKNGKVIGIDSETVFCPTDGQNNTVPSPISEVLPFFTLEDALLGNYPDGPNTINPFGVLKSDGTFEGYYSTTVPQDGIFKCNPQLQSNPVSCDSNGYLKEGETIYIAVQKPGNSKKQQRLDRK